MYVYVCVHIQDYSLFCSSNTSTRLYQDDGLAIKNQTATNTEKIKKEICKIFKEHLLSITADANKKKW